MRAARRRLLEVAGLSALTAAFGTGANADTRSAAPPSYAGAFAADFDSVVQAMSSFYRQHGYNEIEPLPLQTGTAEFNGGLRYDETGVCGGPNEMVVQPVARTEDADRVDRRDVFFSFNIFGTSWHSDDRVSDSLERAFAVLFGPLGLDPGHLLLVSVPQLDILRPTVERVGIDWDRQVIIRDSDEARLAGDGSGHFRHPYPSVGVEMPTVGLHYWIGAADPVFERAYPLSTDWTEVGEICLDPQIATLAVSLGVERLVLARTGLLPG